ncbi:MAG: ABC transporter permease [Acidobacteriia bacterium]|nr:ABC transporter permease [Terriglobia bacterium]
MEKLRQDLRYAVRLLARSPGFALIATLTLALGIGANTAIFSVVNSVLLRPLAYHQPQQLYLIREIVPQVTRYYPSFPANLSNFRIWQRECHSFDAIGLVESASMNLTGFGEPRQIHGGIASANLFEVLGIRPQLGRAFMPDEDQPGRDHVVLLTHTFWHRQFQSDPSVVGRAITLDGAPYLVVGVLPDSFHFPREMGPLVGFGPRMDFFKPLGMNPEDSGLLREFDFAAIARLTPGFTPAQALAELNVVQARIAGQAKKGVDLRADLLPLEAEVIGPARRGLLMLLAAVGAVLLIVCVNLANLLLARIPGRMREAAIRTALGAARSRLVRQMLTESLLLALGGGLLGVVVAYGGVRGLADAASIGLPRLDEVRVDARVLGFALILSALTGVLFGILPAWRIARASPLEALKAGAATTTEGRRARHLRESLVGMEVGLSTLLLILAGLLTMSLVRLLNVNKGFAAEQVLAVDINLPPQSYSQAAARQQFYDRALDSIRALPGVHSAGWVSMLPLEGQSSVSDVSLPGEQRIGGETPLANYRVPSPGYFQTMGIPLIAGRDLTQGDRGRHVVIVSQSLALRFWPGRNPIGQICITGWGGQQRNEVIGVVGDIRTVRLDEPPVLMVYVPDSHASASPGAPSSASFVIRTSMDPGGVGASVRRIIHGVDADVPVVALRPMMEVVSDSVATRRFQMVLVLLFAGCALFLAALGIYGVLSYSVERRRTELGIRMALGAQAHDLRRLVLRQGMAPVLIGLASGVVAALFLGRLVTSFLFGVRSYDPFTIALVTFVVILIAAAACYVPAFRTTRVDPMSALRYE